MPVIECPLQSCTYKTPDVDASVAASLLIIHNNVHINANSSKLKPPKMDRPRIGRDCSEEGWNIFRQKWTIFKDSMELTEVEKSRQLYQCCEEDLGDAILRGHEDIVNLNEQELLKMIKQLAVVPVSVVVRRTDFLSTKQDLTENTRSFAARLKGKASTCLYTCKCPKDGCNQIIDFTDIILKDVMVTGLADEDIRKEVLGWENLDEKNVNETIGFIEGKEMARDAMSKPAVTASIFSYKSLNKTTQKPSSKITCSICDKSTDKFVWSNKNKRYIECSACKQCWIKSRKKVYQSHQNYADESNALLVGGLNAQNSDSFCSRGRRKNMFNRKNANKRTEAHGQKNVLLHTGWRQKPQKSKSIPRLPPNESLIPKVPFESIVCDYFYFRGWYYFVAADKLTGWTEQQKIKLGTNESSSKGLCKALRRIFVTFGVPVEISSSGVTEFLAKVTKDFLKQWGIHHRMLSAYHLMSNGRAEKAIKATKRLLMENVSLKGELNNDRMVQALLSQRNTPDPVCKLSPAQILLGQSLKKSLPYIRKSVMIYNNPQISKMWRDVWSKKEESLSIRCVKSLGKISENTKFLPPLNCGDQVVILNQTGNFPSKWGKSGVVVEVKDCHQCVVKVDGSGRLTVRNRKLLRRFTPPVFQFPFLRKAKRSL